MKLSFAVERLLKGEPNTPFLFYPQRYGKTLEVTAFGRRLIVDIPKKDKFDGPSYYREGRGSTQGPQ